MILAAFNLPTFWSSKALFLSEFDEQCVIQVMRCSKCVLIISVVSTFFFFFGQITTDNDNNNNKKNTKIIKYNKFLY